MSAEKETIGYACENPRCKASVQLAALEREKPSDIWLEDRDVTPFKVGKVRQSYELLTKRLRKGDTLLVYKLFILAPGQRDRHARLVKRMRELADMGVHVRQLAPPLRTTNRGERDTMLAQAMVDLTRVGQHKSSGRPPAQRDPADVEIIRRHWKLATYARDKDALAAMVRDGLKGWSVSMIIQAKAPDGARLFGASGRPYGKRKPGKK